MPRSLIIMFLVCGLAALAPAWSPKPATEHSTHSDFPGWPNQIGGRDIRQLELTEREKRFSRGFAGRIARFTDGRREYILRWVTRPTRRLHPARDCFAGAGYMIGPQPMHEDQQGRAWRCFIAEQDDRRLRVRQRIYDGDGRSWTDVSAWYWAARLGQTKGPWWAIVTVEPAAS